MDKYRYLMSAIGLILGLIAFSMALYSLHLRKSCIEKRYIIGIECPKYEYKIFTKDDFIRYMVNSKKASQINKNAFKRSEEIWDEWRKGYNFMIAVGNEQLMFYSIESFNKCVIGGFLND